MSASIRITPRREDDSWAPDWEPALTLGDDGEQTSWRDLPESEFLVFRFRADATLTVGGQDFSTTYVPVLDFALAWSWVPRALETQPLVETPMTAEGLTYRFERRGDRVEVTSDVHRGSAEIASAELAGLVDQIISDAFDLLYHAHPQLRENRYLDSVRSRIGLA
jgi:hypothetical protein